MAEEICAECGNDLVCEGYAYCTDCLERNPEMATTTERRLVDVADRTTFAARRDAELVAADTDLRPVVVDALARMFEDAEDWFDDIVLTAQVLWTETYDQIGDITEVAEERRRRFGNDLARALSNTSMSAQELTAAQIDRVTRWASTFTVNDATAAAATDGALDVAWVTMGDELVRPSHAALDGVVQEAGSTFDVDGVPLHFPGEPVGPPEAWIECRCVLLPLEAQMSVTAAAPEADVDVDVPSAGFEGLDSELPWHGVLAPTGVVSGDRRMLATDTITFRDFPLPLRWQKADADRHGGSVTVGNITRAWEEDGLIKAEGFFAATDEAAEYVYLLAEGMARGVSIDLDGDTAFELVTDDGSAFDVDAYVPGESPEPIMKVVEGRITSAALVSIPAFAQAYVALGTWEAPLTAAGECVPCAAAEMDAYYEELGGFAISERPWDGSAGRFSDEQWQRATILDRGASYDTAKTRYALPIREPNGDLSRAGAHAAAARINQVDASAEAKAAAKRRLVAAYRQLGDEPPDVLTADAAAWLDVYASPPGTHDAPGWITHPTETQRLRTYWTRGEGAAKIRWGAPGDFNRCRTQLRKYIPNPHYLAGTCANMHKVALGVWPGQETAHALTFADDRPAAIRNAVADALGMPITALSDQARADLDLVINEALGARGGGDDGDGGPPAPRTPARSKPVDPIRAAAPDQRAAIANQVADALQVPIDALSEQAQAALNRVIDEALSRRSSVAAGGQFAARTRSAIRAAVADALGMPISALSAEAQRDLNTVIDEALERRSSASADGTAVFADDQPNRAAIRSAVADAIGMPISALSQRARRALGRVIDEALRRRSATSSAFTLVAGAEGDLPPADWFADPQLSGPTPLTVEGRRVFGHLAVFGTCHVGLGLGVGDGDLCVEPPRSASGYAYFRVHAQRTAEGEIVPVGHITLGTGHAPASMAARPAAAHYDDTGTVVAAVAAGEDEYGIWFAGVLAPDADADLVAAAVLSGDWRTPYPGSGYELVAALGVNVPGFPIPRLQVGINAAGQTALVAAGIVPLTVESAFDATTLAKGVYNEVKAIGQRAERRRDLTMRVRVARRAELASRLQVSGSR